MNHDVNHGSIAGSGRTVGNGRTVADILAETRDELKQFIETRVMLFRTELREKASLIKHAAPLVGAAAVFLGTAYLLFTLALVGLAWALLPASDFRWCFAFLAVAVLWSILGLIAASVAKRHLALKKLVPERTIGVLKGDRVWIQSEVKNQI
jgi:uncharacterized membrane protein YqjE